MEKKIDISKVSESDIEEIVSLHCDIFDGYFLKSLGDEIIFRYYQSYFLDEGTIFLKATIEEEIIGFSLVTSNYSGIIKKFYKDNFLKLAFKIIIEFFKLNPIIINGLKTRVTKLFKIASITDVNEEKNCLLSIAVNPNYQGHSVASRLIEISEDVLKRQSIDAYSLSVKRDNLRAKGFYEKKNFYYIGSKDELDFYSKKLKESEL